MGFGVNYKVPEEGERSYTQITLIGIGVIFSNLKWHQTMCLTKYRRGRVTSARNSGQLITVRFGICVD